MMSEAKNVKVHSNFNGSKKREAININITQPIVIKIL